MLQRVSGGSPPDADTRKLWLCRSLLTLRIRHAEAFGPDGAYTPLDMGPGVVAFSRGDDEVLVAVAVRRSPAGQRPAIAGRWRDVLSGEVVSLQAPADDVGELLGELGIVVLERD
jgi:(1->4)-alpha-D-glucan 1-alpha-D-glucosylmutase